MSNNSNNNSNGSQNGVGKKNFLFISIEGLISDIAWQVSKEGHHVKFFIENNPDKQIGDGFVEKTDNWEKEVDWADVIVFDDVLGQGALAKKLRDKGKLVVGGSPYTDRLEDDRAYGQEELKKAGISIIPYQEFSSFDEAIKFVKANPAKYVIKPSGQAQNIKRLLFVGEEDDGMDVIQILEAYKKSFNEEIKVFQLQRRVTGVEVAVGAFFNGKEFMYPINVNFEHKKLFPGNIGPSTGEMGTLMFFSVPNKLFNMTLKRMEAKLAEEQYVGYIDLNCIVNGNGIYPLEFTCFDKETEIMTQEGWKNYKDVKIGDHAFSINPETKEMAWKPIVNKTIFKHKGKMVKIGSKFKAHSACDILVTPEHKLLVEKNGKTFFERASELRTGQKIVRTGEWHCEHLETVVVPKYEEEHVFGRHKKTITLDKPEIKIHPEYFLKFLGLFLAEGSFGSHGKLIGIPQSLNNPKRAEIEEILNNIGFKYTIQKNGSYQINSVQFCDFLKKLGLDRLKASTKFIPKYFKELKPEMLNHIIEGFVLGDGNIHKRTGQISMATTSKKLADDLQEIILKCGWIANIRTVKAKGTKGIGGYLRNHDIYFLALRKTKTDYYLDKRVIGTQDYEDDVWDVEVNDWHTLLVRRNGKAFFSGNCRFGYPAIFIQQEGIITPMSEFLYQMAKGETNKFKARKGFQLGVRLLLPPYPFDDEKTFDVYSKNAVIIFKKPNYEGVHIEDVRQEKNQWFVTGTSGVVLVVVGTGATVKQAQAQAYHRIDNILIPNMYYRTDIGDRWFEDSDRLHNWGYLRED